VGLPFSFFFFSKAKDLFFLVLHKEHDTISGQRLRLRVLWVRRKKFSCVFFKKKNQKGGCLLCFVGGKSWKANIHRHRKQPKKTNETQTTRFLLVSLVFLGVGKRSVGSFSLLGLRSERFFCRPFVRVLTHRINEPGNDEKSLSFYILSFLLSLLWGKRERCTCVFCVVKRNTLKG
jgi:hypothetical protein